MYKEYTIYGDYIIAYQPYTFPNGTTREYFTSYINVSNNIYTLSNMTVQEIVNIISGLSIIDTASLLSTMTDLPENIQRVSQILLQLPIEKVYSIIPTMMEHESIIVSILLNMPIPIIALIIANMNIPQLIVFPVTSNISSVNNLQKAIILSSMPVSKAALILSHSNMPTCQAALILSNMSKDISSLILSNMSNNQAILILSNI